MDHSKQMGEAKIAKLLVKFSVPAIVGMLVNALYSVVDRIFIGNSAGALGIAGITICFPIMLVMMASMILVGIGASALISIRLGEKNKEEAEHILGNAFVLLIIISLSLSTLGSIFLDPLLKLFGASKDVLPYAKDFMQIILLGAIFQGIGYGMNNFIRGEGNPKIAMLTMLLGAVLNAIFCPVFIFGLGMGIKGSALATILAQAFAAAWVLYYFFFGKSILKIRFKNLKLDRRIVGKIVTLGSAPFAMQLATSLVNVILNWSLVKYGGDIAISAIGIVTSLQILIIMPLMGINQGAQPIIGYNYGAKNYQRVRETLKLAILGATVIAVLGFILVEIFPRPIVSLFNRENAVLIDFAVYAMRIFLMMLPIIGFQMVGAHYFMAVGKPKHSTFLSLSRQLILLIPAILILPLFFKLPGVVMAGPVADLGSAIITGILIFRELKYLNDKHERHLAAQA
jgi:putative MATE family efflux protein